MSEHPLGRREEPLPDIAAVAALSSALRGRLADIADQLIPSGDGMPAASGVGVADRQLAVVLHARPDLLEPLRRVLSIHFPGSAIELLDAIEASDPEGHEALVLVVLGGYYLSEDVTVRLVYPGQQAVAIAPDTYPPYVDEGLLDAVVDRGPIYRPTPSR